VLRSSAVGHSKRASKLACLSGRFTQERLLGSREQGVEHAEADGEAGAIARYGPALGIPRAYSGHNAFWRFGPRDRAPRSS
jgi:hypothetical protein